MTLQIKFTDYKPYVESGSGETLWFEYEGQAYYVEMWSTRHSSGTDIYTVEGSRDANSVIPDDNWDEFYDLCEETRGLVMKAQESVGLHQITEHITQSALDQVNAQIQTA